MMGNYPVRFGGRERGVLHGDATLPTQYFAHVRHIDTHEHEDSIRVWIGGTFDEVQAPEELRGPISAYGSLTDEVIALLHADRGKIPGT